MSRRRASRRPDVLWRRRCSGLGRHGDAVARPVVGAIVAREPRRCADRLRGDERAVLELLPPDRSPPGAPRAGRAAVQHLDRERPPRARACGPGVTRSLRVPCWNDRAAVAVHAHARRAQPDQVERDGVGPDRRDRVDDGAALEPVGADAVVRGAGRTTRRRRSRRRSAARSRRDASLTMSTGSCGP